VKTLIGQWETLDLNSQLNLIYQALIALIMIVMMTYFFLNKGT